MLQIFQSETTAALRRVPFYLVDATDGRTPETGVTLIAGDLRISKNGGAHANHAGTWGEVGEGEYYYEFTAGEHDTLGYLIARLSKAGISVFPAVAQVIALNLYDAAAAGLSRLDAAVSTRLATAGYTAPPTAAAIRAEMDSNSVDLDTIGSLATNIQADTDNIQGRLPAALVGGRMAANAEVVGDKAGYELTAGERTSIATAIWDFVVFTGFSAARVLRKIFAATAGKLVRSGVTHTFYAPDGTTAEIVGTADSSGNRTPTSYES